MSYDYSIDPNFRRAVDQEIWQQVPRQQPVREVQVIQPHHDLSGLAKAGIAGIMILAVIAVFCGILAILPKSVRVLVILAFIGWIIWLCAFPPKVEEPKFVAPPPQEVVPRAELVQPEVRRAILVNPHPRK
jgi:hypothetical protein